MGNVWRGQRYTEGTWASNWGITEQGGREWKSTGTAKKEQDLQDNSEARFKNTIEGELSFESRLAFEIFSWITNSFLYSFRQIDDEIFFFFNWCQIINSYTTSPLFLALDFRKSTIWIYLSKTKFTNKTYLSMMLKIITISRTDEACIFHIRFSTPLEKQKTKPCKNQLSDIDLYFYFKYSHTIIFRWIETVSHGLCKCKSVNINIF